MKDYYDILGVARDASNEEIKKRFRQLARETHPDANPGDAGAEERFREIAEAYEVLSDPQRRARYDRGETLDLGDLFSNFGSLNDILNSFFGGIGVTDPFGGTTNRRGRDMLLAAGVTLAEAATGTETVVEFVTPVTCETCEGSGAADGTQPETCPQCAGHGVVQISRRTFLGTMASVQPCDRCNGRGQIVRVPCATCGGRTVVDGERQLSVKVPAGVETGSRLRIRGEGGAGEAGTPPGDLYVEIEVAPDPRFERAGADLIHRVDVGVSEAILGSKIDIPLVDGHETDLEIPAGTQPNTVIRIPGEGMGRLDRRGRGDLLVEVNVVIPRKISDEEEELVRRLAELRGERPAERVRSRWRRSR